MKRKPFRSVPLRACPGGRRPDIDCLRRHDAAHAAGGRRTGEKTDGVQSDVIDLLTISPLDHDRFAESVKKTGRAVVVHEAPRSFGVAAEITARLVEKSFLYLEAPVKRVTGFDIHMPLFQREKQYLPNVERILTAARQTLDF